MRHVLTRQSSLVLIAGAVTVGSIAFASGLLVYDARLAEIEPAPSPLTMTVELTSATIEHEVSLELVWDHVVPIYSPNWAGTVTEVFVEPGATLRSGEPILAIDGVKRIAAAMRQPLFRDLRRGDRGEDVRALQEFLLVEQLYVGEADGVYGGSLADAVAELRLLLGAPKLRDGGFDHTLLVWIPDGLLQVDSVHATIGQPADGGVELILPKESIAGASFRRPEGAPPLRGMWQFESAQHEPIVVSFVEDDRLDAESVAEIGVLVTSDDVELDGRLLQLDPTDHLYIPVSAVTTGSDGQLCSWVKVGESFEPREVAVGPGAFGVAEIAEGLAPGDVILVNPDVALAEASCP